MKKATQAEKTVRPREMKAQVSETVALACAKAALDKKAENVKILRISELSSVADFLVICSGSSDRQVQAIADSISHQLKSAGHSVLSTEGYSEGRWVLIDCGDTIVHVFQDALRDYYRLDELWQDAGRVSIPQDFYYSQKH